MPGTNSGGDDPLPPTESNEPGSADERLATPLTPPISEADQRQWDEDRERARRLIERLERMPIPEAPEPEPYVENDLLPPGWEWREGENGIVLPVAPPPDPNEPATVIIRFLDNANGTINGRPVLRGTIAEVDSQTAKRLFAYRPMGLPPGMWPAKVEYATPDHLNRYEAAMLEVDKNAEATARDPLSQQLGMVPPETPKLIVRFIRDGCASAPDDPKGQRNCGIGEVWPVEKELAIRHLLETDPVVELATPEELKRDRDTIDHSEGQSKSQVDARRKHRFKNGIPHSGPSTLVVRFLTPGRFAIHVSQGIIYEKRSEGCESLPCAAGEIWEIEQDFAYRLLRGKSPIGTLATDAEWEAYRAIFTGEPVAVEPAEQGQTQPARLVLDVVPVPVAVGPAEQGQTGEGRKTAKPKKKGGQRLKTIAALSAHHQYDGESCLNLEPIGVGTLAKLAQVSVGTVTNLLWEAFDGSKGSSMGFVKYKRACQLKNLLIERLKSLNGDTRPRRHRSIRDESSLADESPLDDE